MFDLHDELNRFYEQHVRLGNQRETLAQYRDRNIERLKSGLDALEYPKSFRHCNQGSYAMHTINQHPENDYDIDVGLIFPSGDLPSSAYDTRKRIEAAMLKGGGNFRQPPKALTNAVRVYYAEGYHIDLAIYREYLDDYGHCIVEHAGSDWTPRDPMDITNWFNETVRNNSPSKDYGATVDKNQMRRIVRWLKAFAKSRTHWDIPGGLIISVLVAECYRANFHRDDVSLNDSMIAICDRLEANDEVLNPVDTSQALTDRPVDTGRVKRFKEQLNRAISKLEILSDSDCTEVQAYKAWYWMFQHDFWNHDGVGESVDDYGKRLGTAAVEGEVYFNLATGQLDTRKPVDRHVQVPRQRFYGDE